MMGNSENPYQKRRTFFTVVTILLVLSVLTMLISRTDSDAYAKPRAFIDGVTTPVINLITMPIRGAEKIGHNFRIRSNAVEENQHLKTEIARLKGVEIRAKALSTKINRFEEILQTDIIDDIPVEKIPARAVSETNGPFVRSALLNAGRIQGIKPGHAVMTTNGLYGHIVRAGQRSSRALLLNDLNSRIAVKSERSDARAILTGNNSNIPQLSFVGPEADWAAGDRVVTSGDEGVFPAGLPIGETKKGDANRKFGVSLYSAKQPIDWVWVYPYTPTLPPENEVMQSSISEEATETNSERNP